MDGTCIVGARVRARLRRLYFIGVWWLEIKFRAAKTSAADIREPRAANNGQRIRSHEVLPRTGEQTDRLEGPRSAAGERFGLGAQRFGAQRRSGVAI